MISLKYKMSCLSLIFIFVVATSTHTTKPASDNSQTNKQPITQIVMLGTGTPNADPERSGPSVAIVVNDTPYIVDCGPGVVRRAAAAYQKGVTGLKVDKLKTAFVTHLHSDHTLGFADLIFTPWTLERQEPLKVFGPRGIKTMSHHLLQAYREDIEIRTKGLEPSNKTGYRVIAEDLKPGMIYQDKNVRVKAFRVPHGSWREAFGFRFETPDKTIVISGDATPAKSVIDNCDGCDVLIHEVYSTAGFARRPPEWQKYHANFHTSSRQLADLATQTKPGLLILYHQLFWGTSEADLVKEVQQFYSGKVVSARDLDIY
ncbi:MAG: MBL fold metallo-hydrolase [Acidobacteriota bacterium]